MKQYIFLLFTTILFLFGCQDKEGPVGPSLSGDIIGRVQVNDSTGNVGNLSGVLVQLEGTNYLTYSDSSGVWKLTGVKTGTYIISCTKQGYSTAKNTSFQFVGGNQPANGGFFTLYQLPSRFVKTLSTPKVNQNVISIKGTLSTVLSGYSTQFVLTYAGFDSSASLLPAKFIIWTHNFVQATDTFTVSFDINTLKSLGAKSGSKLYFVSFAAVNTYAGYYDIVKQEFIFTGLSLTPSNIVSIVVP